MVSYVAARKIDTRQSLDPSVVDEDVEKPNKHTNLPLKSLKKEQ